MGLAGQTCIQFVLMHGCVMLNEECTKLLIFHDNMSANLLQ